MCRSKHVEQLRNTGIINSTTQSHLVGYFYTIYHSTHFNMAFIGKYFSSSVVRLGASSDGIPVHDYIGIVLFISQFLRQMSK